MAKSTSQPGESPVINLQRAVYVNTTIDEPLTAKLTPEIMQLRATSDQPITLFIDSFGGSTDSLSFLLDLLRTHTAGQHNCPVVTQVVGHASSAAAVLLVNGDHAIAYPHATIHFHGVRVSEAQNLTVEEANRFAAELNRINKVNAIDLSRHFVPRILKLYAEFLANSELPKPDQPRERVDLFYSSYLAANVSHVAKNILDDATTRTRDNLQLLAKIRQRQAEIPNTEDGETETHAIILHEIILHEIRRHKLRQGEISASLLTQIAANYQAICKYFRGDFDSHVADILTAEQRQLLPNHELQATLNLLLAYTIFLCQRLQQDENALSATDAYWLGIVDEVLPYDLPTDRKLLTEIQKPT